MELKNIMIINLWHDIDKQNWDNLASYFSKDAAINWHNTKESFSIDEFVTANSEYPGDWTIQIKRLIELENTVISVVQVCLKNDDISFHATSFFQFNHDNKIELLDEYWGEDGEPPQWRIDKGIGKRIK